MTAALITKESTKLPTEGMPAGQFRHGPMEVVSAGVAVCLFAAPGRADALNLKLAHDLAHLPGQIVTLADASFVTDARKILVPIETSVNEWLAPIAEIIPVQLLAARLAEIRGYDTSRFVYGSKVTVNE
jgi:glucosamine--fructose-6-phosphate aminotransferase (isomerizing)